MLHLVRNPSLKRITFRYFRKLNYRNQCGHNTGRYFANTGLFAIPDQVRDMTFSKMLPMCSPKRFSRFYKTHTTIAIACLYRKDRSLNRLSFNQRVVGSNPAAPTKPTKGLGDFRKIKKYRWGAHGEHFGKSRVLSQIFFRPVIVAHRRNE